MNSYSMLTHLLPDILKFIEVQFGPGNGEQKQTEALNLLTAGLTEAGCPGVIISIIVGICKIIIPMLVKKYNEDPANTTFTKSGTP